MGRKPKEEYLTEVEPNDYDSSNSLNVESQEQSVLDKKLKLEDLEGVGATTAKKLRENGVFTPEDLASCNSNQLIEDGITDSRETAERWINAAVKLLDDDSTGLTTARQELENRKGTIERITTGSKELDKLLGGGIETKAVTEFYGEFGSGKTQLCQTLSLMAQLPKEEGGLDGTVYYIDAEGTFRPERLNEIIRNRFEGKEEMLDRVFVGKANNTEKLWQLVKGAGKHIDEQNVKLLIVDSLTNLFRDDYTGRGQLAERQQKMNTVVHKLTRIAEYFNIAVVFTNQVVSAPDTFFGDPLKAAGGNVTGHGSTYRIYLKKSGANKIATFIDSPYHAYTQARFSVDESGVIDVPEKKEKKKEE